MRNVKRNLEGAMRTIRLLATLLVPGLLLAQPEPPIRNQVFEVALLSKISTETSKKDDKFTARVSAPAEYEGAIMEGRITQATKAGRKEPATILFAFETLEMTDNGPYMGAVYKIQADFTEVANSKGVAGVDEEGQVIANKNTNRGKAAAAGAVGGALLGGLTGGWKGAAAGTAIGAVAGWATAVTMTSKSQNMEFLPGSKFTLNVTQKGRLKEGQ